MQVQDRKSRGPAACAGQPLDVEVEHDRGPFNGRAEIAGAVIDRTAAAVEGASSRCAKRPSSGLRTRDANASGQFTLAGLPAGEYEVQCRAPGFKATRARSRSGARPRGPSPCCIRRGCQVRSRIVVADPRRGCLAEHGRWRTASERGVVGGVPGGVIGGVIGGIVIGRGQASIWRVARRRRRRRWPCAWLRRTPGR